jgi:hypothetical protein
LPVREESIAPALTAFDQFIVWDYLLRDDRWTKPLYRVTGSGFAKSTDPAGWGSFRAALAAYRSRHLAGIGFVLMSDDPFCFGDLDDCRDPATGDLSPWAQRVVERFRHSYQEVSPSGTGIKILIRGRLPGTEHRWRLNPADPLAYVEWFDAAKYTTLTGHRVPGTGEDVAEGQAELDELYRECFPQATDPVPAPSVSTEVFAQLDDDALIEKARNARNGDRFRSLFDDGDTAPYNHDESAADLALCDLLAFWLGNDPIRIDRVFRRSALMRDKWERRAGYRKLTIDKALAGRTAFYSPPAHLPRPAVIVPNGTGPPIATNGAHEPVPMPIQEQPWPELDEAALDGLAGDIVFYLAPHTEADDVATLVTFLVLFGAACNRGPHMMVGEDRHGVNLFAALVGETSKARKGTSLAGPERVIRFADAEFVANRIEGGLSSGEGLVWYIRDEVKKVGKGGQEEIVVDAVTDKRLVCVEEELAGVLKACERSGNTLSETVRRAWDARRRLQTMTKNSQARATDPHVSIIAHVTATEITRTLTDTSMANGLGNRFLWFCVRRSKVLPEPGRLGERELSELGYRVTEALAFGRAAGAMRRDDEAKVLWADAYPVLSEGKPGLAGALIARAEAQVLRLSLLYAILDGSSIVRASHLRSALALWRYADASVMRVFGEATGDPNADRIYAALTKNGGMTQSDLLHLFARNMRAADLGRALESLVAAGKVRSRSESTGGRPTTTWERIS